MTADFEISMQGKPLIDTGYIVAKGKNIVAVELAMQSKWCVFTGSMSYKGTTSVIVSPSERSTHLLDEAEGEDTVIKFTTSNGWRLFCGDCSRYIFSLCFIREHLPLKR